MGTLGVRLSEATSRRAGATLGSSSPNTAQRFLQYFPLFFSSDHIPIAIVHTQVSSALLSSAGQTEHCELEKVDSLESVMRYRP